MKMTTCKLLAVLLACLLLLPTLASCAGLGGMNMQVDFIVDGAVYDSINLANIQTEALPANPVKEGYHFRGWYLDEGVWQEPFSIEAILTGSISSTINVYAYFVPITENGGNGGNGGNSGNGGNGGNSGNGGNGGNEPASPSGLQYVKPVPGKAYKMVLEQEKANAVVYLNGEISTYYFATTADINASVDVFVEAVPNAGNTFYMYCIKDGVKQYLNMIRSGTFNNPTYGDAPTATYVYDDGRATMLGVLEGATLLFGTNAEKSYTTIGLRYLDEPNFVVHFIESPTEEPEDPTVPNGAPVLGTGYRLVLVQENLESARYYFTGEKDSYYLATSQNEAEAVTVYLEAGAGGDNGYYLYFINAGGEKQYLNIETVDTHTNPMIGATAKTLFTYDSELKTMVTEHGGRTYGFGTNAAATYTNLAARYLDGANFFVQFVAVESDR